MEGEGVKGGMEMDGRGGSEGRGGDGEIWSLVTLATDIS